MTDSAVVASGAVEAGGKARPGKRDRLVAAATQLIHQQGIERTTLADIAKAADVPAGNVYYYFKTKDDVVAAVVDAHTQQVHATLAAIDAAHRTPKARLKAFVREFAAQSEVVAEFGCPLGSLCSELDKRVPDKPTNDAGPTGADLLRVPIAWAERQFRALGRRDAHDRALDLLAAYEGSALLANTLDDPKLLADAARRLDRWIESL
jgi:TetR/AcrR family transcriptional regulator, transcriptional repressor for nem operon